MVQVSRCAAGAPRCQFSGLGGARHLFFSRALCAVFGHCSQGLSFSLCEGTVHVRHKVCFPSNRSIRREAFFTPPRIAYFDTS
jgi:hypothetical protein